MAARQRIAVLVVSVTLGACSSPPAQHSETPPPAPVVPLVEPKLERLHDYKVRVADRIVGSSADTYSQPMPAIMKSIVVLEITIDMLGHPTAVSVYRSNGYRRLEERAVASVTKAAPYPLPAPELLQGGGSLTFLETFLFRDDDFFQVRSLVPPDWKYSGHEKLF